jgi:hypothetical protein
MSTDQGCEHFNALIARCEALIRARGTHNATLGGYEDGVFTIVAGVTPRDGFGLNVMHGGRDVFRAEWGPGTAAGRWLIYRPGPWEAELLARPGYHA